MIKKHKSGKQYIHSNPFRQRLVTLVKDLGKECLIEFHDKSIGLVETKELIREATLKDLLVVDNRGCVPIPDNWKVIHQIKIKVDSILIFKINF